MSGHPDRAHKAVGGGPRVKSQIFELLVLGDSTHQGDSKMG